MAVWVIWACIPCIFPFTWDGNLSVYMPTFRKWLKPVRMEKEHWFPVKPGIMQFLHANALITVTGQDFSMVVETKRMAPGATNNWFIEVYGTEGSARFSTHNPKAFEFITTIGKEQGWTRIDMGSQSAIPSITGGIFEFGFSDAFQQMIGAFIHELSGNGPEHPFKNVYSGRNQVES